MTEETLTKRTPEAHANVLKRFREYRSKNHYEPPSKEGTIVTPGFDGGPGWGGAAYDPATGFLIVNSNEVPCIAKIIERPQKAVQATAKNIYERNCSSCHGKDLSGTPPEFPALTRLNKKYNDDQTLTIIRGGVGRMPGFGGSLNGESLRAVTKFLLTGEDSKVSNDVNKPSIIDQKYMMEGYPRFLDPDGYPAISPPWGTLNAIDLNKGTIAWQIPFGEYPELLAKGMRDTGSWSYGGPITTAGGLIFIGATNYDRKFRAFDVRNGKLLWEQVMPFAGNATPMTYEVKGKQFVVIAAGGGKRGAPSGGTYVAYALPTK